MANCTFRPEKLFEGTYSDEIGQAKCKYCPAGFYQNTPESKNCISCPAGWYQSDEGRVYCDACDIGKYSDKEAAKSNRDCFDCATHSFLHKPSIGLASEKFSLPPLHYFLIGLLVRGNH